jgi:hypothetical protein
MNRQLKFRIWSKKDTNFLHNIEESQDLLHSDGEWYFLGGNKLDENYAIQQFTELYDKNKKPIYEGDRVRFGYTKNEDFFGEVIWLEDRASFGVRTKNAFETFEDLMDYMKYFEVVGNIFQLPCNPDHNGECLVCDCWLSDCEFLNKEKHDKDV